MTSERSTDLTRYFGEKATGLFWDRLAALGVEALGNNGIIELSPFKDDLTSFTSGLLGALDVLINSDQVSIHARERDFFLGQQRAPFLDSAYGPVHEALFSLSERYSFVWVEGWKDYMLRTAHKAHPSSGVSLVLSEGPDRLLLGQMRFAGS